MSYPAWDFMLDDETYRLLEEEYGSRLELSSVVQNMDRDGIVRMLDYIVEGAKDFGEEEVTRRAKEAKIRVLKSR